MPLVSRLSDQEEQNRNAKHILQSWQWGQFRAQTPQVKTVIRLKSKNKIFQVFFHRLPHLPGSIAYLPRSPMPNKSEIEQLVPICQKESALCLKIEPSDRRNWKLHVGRPVLPRHTIYIDLSQGEGKILASMHEKTRYNIRLAQKKGVVVSEGEGLEHFIKLLENTEARQGFYSHNPEYYRILWRTLRPEKMVYLLSASLPNSLSPDSQLESRPVASIMLFRFKEFFYYPYGGSDPKYKNLMAPHLLHWEAIKLGKRLGCKVYDMWGSYKEKPDESDPWWGIYRFKKGFGGKEITFPETVDLPLSPLYALYPLVEKFRNLTR